MKLPAASAACVCAKRLNAFALPGRSTLAFVFSWRWFPVAAACLTLAALAVAADKTPAPAQLPKFVDVAAPAGVDFVNHPSRTSRKYLLESMVGGVALLDYNGDGFLDIYFVNGAKLEDPMEKGQRPDKSDPKYWNRLYRNNGDGTFTDVTEQAGVAGEHYGQGAAAGDYDGDGHTDLYVLNYGVNILYRNNGDGTFTDVTAEAGVSGGGWSVGAVFFDYDHDGDLDLAVSRYVKWDFSMDLWCGDRKPGYRSYCHPDHFDPIPHLLYRNNGDGTFTDVSEESGIASAPGKGLGIAINDFDRDGWEDLLIANDSFPQQLFRNRGDGTFEETALFAGMAYDEDGGTFAGMGVDFADYDNDGWPDAFINALPHQKYALFRNSEGFFEYVSGPSGVSTITALHSGWGAKFIDYDNDGWRDIFVAQSHVMDNIALTQPDLSYEERFLLMRNTGGKFEDVSERSGKPFSVKRASRGAAFGDLNNDGFLDVVVNCNEEPAAVLINQGNGAHWLMLELEGRSSNREGIGAKVRLVSASGAGQHAMVSRGGSYLSSNDKRVHFGLGGETRVKLVEITWPSGVVQTLENVAADQILKVAEPAGATAKAE